MWSSTALQRFFQTCRSVEARSMCQIPVLSGSEEAWRRSWAPERPSFFRRGTRDLDRLSASSSATEHCVKQWTMDS